MPYSDAALLSRIPADRAALERFYRRHVDGVERFAVSRCRNPAETAELVSAVFLAVIDSAPGYDPGRGPARAWLLGIASRLLASEQRRWWRDEAARRRFAARRLGITPVAGRMRLRRARLALRGALEKSGPEPVADPEGGRP